MKILFLMLIMASLSFANRLVCVAGGSAAGKTTYVHKLKAYLGQKAMILEMDHYSIQQHLSTPEERMTFNWDDPAVIDWTLLKQHLVDLKNGKSIEAPVYHMANSTRADYTVALDSAETILFEGTHALYHADIRELCDKMYFISASDEVRLERRTKRDAVERNFTPEQTLVIFSTKTNPMHHQFIEPVKNHFGVITLEQSQLTIESFDEVERHEL